MLVQIVALLTNIGTSGAEIGGAFEEKKKQEEEENRGQMLGKFT